MSSWAASKHGQVHWRSAHEVLDVLVWWLSSESQHRVDMTAQMPFFHLDLRESIDDSWTVVIGPSSGTLTLRRRAGTGRLCSLNLNRRPPAVNLSVLSAFWPMARAKACSGARTLTGEAVFWCSLGNSWYFLESG